MKTGLILVLLLMTAGEYAAAQKVKAVAVRYPALAVQYVQQPVVADNKVLPFVEAKATAAGSERFGLVLGGVPATTPVVEILNAQGKVMKSLSVNDIIGKGVSREEKLLPSVGTKLRRAETIYTVRLADSDARVIMKAIATGDDGAAEQEVIVTFSLNLPQAMEAALRVSLPFAGTAQAVENGVVLMPKKGNVAVAAAILPASVKALAAGEKLTVESAVSAIPASQETPLVWIVMRGVSSSSPTDAKTQAHGVIGVTAARNDEPRIVVVNAVDKEKLAQADTVSYTLICANVGSGEALNVVLGNPVPKGSRYLEGSATTSGTVFSAEKKGEGESGQTLGLKWSLSSGLKPGEERIISFKLVLE